MESPIFLFFPFNRSVPFLFFSFNRNIPREIDELGKVFWPDKDNSECIFYMKRYAAITEKWLLWLSYLSHFRGRYLKFLCFN